MLSKLREKTGNNEEVIQHHIESYIKDISKHLRKLRTALEEEDYYDIRTVVNEAKSHFTTMGFDDLYKLANHVEIGINKRYSREMSKEHTISLVEDIQHSIDELKKLR